MDIQNLNLDQIVDMKLYKLTRVILQQKKFLVLKYTFRLYFYWSSFFPIYWSCSGLIEIAFHIFQNTFHNEAVEEEDVVTIVTCIPGFAVTGLIIFFSKPKAYIEGPFHRQS